MPQTEWTQLREECLGCRACALADTRTNVVFGVGSEQAEILFIGEGPGANEDLQGEPFVGRAGQLLDKMLAVVGLSRKENVYIANMVKCRPPQNRDPLPEEQDACSGWLKRQIELLDPKIIVCLGRVAACRFLSPEFRVTRQHGQFMQRDGRLVMGTFHPAAILRNQSQKPDWFQDFIALRDKIGEVCTRTRLVFPE